jgi:hypothetical protein
MSEQILERLNEVFSLIPCPIVGCWPLHGAELVYYYDRESECHTLEAWPVGIEESAIGEAGAHNDNASPLLYELAEFDFTELVKAVPLEHFHFSQQRAVSEIGWKEFGKDLEIKAHLVPRGVDHGS